jgi:adenylate cyclase
MPAAGAGLAILLAGAGRVFVSSHAVMGVAGPFVEVVGFVGLASSWRYVDESRQRRRMRRAFEAYFPPAVVARLVESGQSFDESRRRELTIMFTDIAGFTARSSTMPPDEVQGFLNSYFSRMVEVAFRHGGTVDKFIGDGLMVFFNDPDDQPDHAERAVRCAIDMQAAVRAFSAEREADGEPPVRLRIGVHTGWAIVGALGSVERLSYTAVGAAVNMAQRLESNAPAGRVLVSAETASRLPPGIAVSRAPAIDAKGFDRPVDVYLIEPGLETGVS